MLSRITDEDHKKLSQGVLLKQFNYVILAQCSQDAPADLQSLDSNLRDKLAWSYTNLLRSILVFLDTCSWTVPARPTTDTKSEHEQKDDIDEVKVAADHIATVLCEPLESTEHHCDH